MPKSRKEQILDMLVDMPGDLELRYMLGMEFASEGDDEGAVRSFRELRAIDPNYPPAYHMEARALVRLGRVGDAREVLRQGIPAAQRQGNHHAAGEMTELLESLGDV